MPGDLVANLVLTAGTPGSPAADRYRAAPARAGSVTRTAVTAAGGWTRRPRADSRSMASSTARV